MRKGSFHNSLSIAVKQRGQIALNDLIPVLVSDRVKDFTENSGPLNGVLGCTSIRLFKAQLILGRSRGIFTKGLHLAIEL